MESKLPKPTELRRPLPVMKDVLPKDSMNAQSAFESCTDIGASGTTGRILSKDVNQQTNKQTSHARSRSASDLQALRQMKNSELTQLPQNASASNVANATANPAIPCLGNMDNKVASINVPGISVGLPSAASAETGASGSMIRKGLQITRDKISDETLEKLRRSCSASEIRVKKIIISRPTKTDSNTVTSVVDPKSLVNVSSATDHAARATKNCSASNKEVASTSVASTDAGKCIPAYDFKDRFYDLQEKYKALKVKYDEKCEQLGSLKEMPEQLQGACQKLSEAEDKLRVIGTERSSLIKENKTLEKKFVTISGYLVSTKKVLSAVKSSCNALKTNNDTLTSANGKLHEDLKRLTKANKKLEKDVEFYKDQLFRANIERKEMHNTIMDLRGNIRVFCRVRPPLDYEKDKPLCTWTYIDERTLEVQCADVAQKNKNLANVFNFDQVFPPAAKQEDIFEMVSPLVQSALDGYNVCIFAYGQTGSGKTYTMEGIQAQAGVIPRTIDLLFDAIENYKRLGWEYEIKVTFLEIYNEVLYDLLSNEQKEMEIRMVKNNKEDVYVSNITEEIVVTASQLTELMQVASKNRATASTAGNERSSRSHAVTKIELTGHHAEQNDTCVGKINLVDLAGSESPKTSLRMTETKNINRSLSELTNVILALLQKQDHIPYRNSKLTHLLMPSLGGNSKTLMCINVSSFQDCFAESVKSLRFATSVNSCKTGKAKKNRCRNAAEIKPI